MIEITLDEMVDMITQPLSCFWDDQCWLVDQDSGQMKQIPIYQLVTTVERILHPMIQTDDEGGNLSMVTLDIHFDMTHGNLRTGKLIRLYLCKKELISSKGCRPQRSALIPKPKTTKCLL